MKKILNIASYIIIFFTFGSCSADSSSEDRNAVDRLTSDKIEEMAHHLVERYSPYSRIKLVSNGLDETIFSIGYGSSSLVTARCLAYAGLTDLFGEKSVTETIEDNTKKGVLMRTEETTFIKSGKLYIAGISLDTKSTTKKLVKRTANKSIAKVSDIEAASKEEIIVSMKSDFGDLTLNCNIVQGLNNGSRSYKESGSYSQSDKDVEIFFKKMSKMGLKEDIFRRGAAIGITLKYEFTNSDPKVVFRQLIQ